MSELSKQTNNTDKGSSLGQWVQQALFTRSADSYLNPLIQGVAPALVFSRSYQQASVLDLFRHSENAMTITVLPPKDWKGFIPGQYVSCEFEIKGVRIKRNYSISSSRQYFEKTGRIRLTIHRVEGGEVSNFILDELRLDTRFAMSDAMGVFAAELDSADQVQKPLLFLAAGSGITPFAAIVGSNQLQGRKTLLMYSCKTASDHLFSDAFAALAEQSENFKLHLHSTREGESCKRMDASLLENKCREAGFEPDQCEVFICGGNEFSEDMSSALMSLGCDEDAIHRESFDSQFRFSAEEGKVNFIKSAKHISGESTESILEQAESLGLNPESGCRMGICHSCTCTKKSGVVLNIETGELSSADEEEIRICISQAVGQVEINL